MKHLIVLLFLFLSLNIFSVVEGDRPSTSNMHKFSIFGSVESMGNTMMEASPPGNANDILLTNSDGDLNKIPYDAEIERVYLYWTGSLGVTLFSPDNDVVLRYPDGISNLINADNCRVVNSMEGFYYCSADITNQMKPHKGAFNYNGRYNVSGLIADPGNCVENPYICQAKYAAWSMVVVYKSPSATSKRDIVIYDSFLHMDEREDSIGVDQFTISGFKVKSPVVAEFTFFGLEGDRFLGVPPQDQDPNFPCATCYDFISLDGQKLHDDLNLENNIWNSSLALGVDIDSFNIGNSGLNILSENQESVVVRLGSGDGIIPNAVPEAGGGESLFLGYVILALDTLSPNFRTTATNLTVDRTEAAQGDILTYFINVTNEGSLQATNIRILDAIPDYVDYISGSTIVDGQVVNDSINSPSGLNIGNIDFRGDNNKIIRFQVRIRNNVANGTEIYNKIKIVSTELQAEPAFTNRVKTTVVAPDIKTPILTFRDENGANHIPGDWIEYKVKMTNTQNNPISNIKYKETLSQDFIEVQTLSFVGDVTLENGRITISIDGLEIPENSYIILRYRARLKTISEFIDSGVGEDQINNRVVVAQGAISAPSIPNSILTDNDNGGNEHDPTTFIIKKEVNANFSESTKKVENVNGTNIFKPGDRVKYTIEVKNSATSSVNNIKVLDDIDERYLDDIIVNGGNYDGDKITWFISNLSTNATTSLTFTAKIKVPILNGTIVSNQAIISVIGRTDLTDDPNTPQSDDKTSFTITSESNFEESTKTYIDENGGSNVQPGELVTYIITLKNSGNGIGENLEVTDTIGPDLEVVEVLNNGVFDNITRKVTWSYLTNPELVRVSSEVSLKLRVRVHSSLDDGDTVSNQAEIHSGLNIYLTDDPSTTQINDATTFDVYKRAELSESQKIFEDINGGFIEAGDIIRYTIKVRNTGLLPTTNVIVTDAVDTTNLEDITLESAGSFNNDIITWEGGALSTVAPNSVVELKFTAKIKDNTNHGTIISNQALIRSDQFLFILTDDPTTDAIDDATKFKVTSFPELTFTKTYVDVNGGDVEVNDEVKYTITITNSNKTETGLLKIADIIPNELKNINSDNGTIDGDTIKWDISLGKGDSVDLTLKGNIKLVPDQALVCNQATLDDEILGLHMVTNNPLTSEADDKTCFNVTSNLEISDFEKTFEDLNGGEIRPGDLIKYTIKFKNTGNIPITDIEIKDIVSTDLEDIIVTNGALDENTIIWNSTNTPELENIESDDEIELTFTAKIIKPLANGTTISNQATIKIGEYSLVSDDPTTPEVNDETKFNIISAADIKLTKEVKNLNGSDIFMPKDKIIYILKVENIGDDFANNLVIKDTINEYLKNVVSDTGNININEITWDSTTNSELLKLDNTPLVITIRAEIFNHIPNDTEISNQLFLTGDNVEDLVSDDPTSNEENDATIFIVKAPHIKVEKSVLKREYTIGEEFEYTIKLTNDSEVFAKNLRFSDNLDNNLEFVSVSNSACVIFDDSITCSHNGNISKLKKLEPNDSFEVKIKVKVKNGVATGTIIENTALFFDDYLAISDQSDDPNTIEEDDSTKITVKQAADLVFEKVAIGTPYIGNTIIYELKVTNNSNANIDHLVASDILPEELEFVEFIDNNTNCNFDTFINCEFLIEANSTKLIKIKARIKYSVTENQEISNQAILSLPPTICETGSCPIYSNDPSTPEDTDPTKIIAILPPDVTFTKTTPKKEYFAGDAFEYTIKVRNNTWGILENVVINDSIDMNLIQSIELNKPCDILETLPVQIVCNSSNNPELANFTGNTEFELKIKVKIKDDIAVGTKIYNQATLDSDSFLDGQLSSDDPTTQASDDKTVVTIKGTPNVLATKEVFDDNLDGVFIPGELISYKIKVKNISDTDISNILIKDSFPVDKLDLLENDNRFIIDPDTGVITLSYQIIQELRSLATNEEVEFTIFAKIKDELSDNMIVSNQAEVRYFESSDIILTDDPNTDEENDSTKFTVSKKADLMNFYKEVFDLDGNDFLIGDEIKYVLRVKNVGAVAAKNVIISDLIDTTKLEIVRVDNGKVENENNVIFDYDNNENLKSIEPNEEVVFTIIALIKNSVQEGSVISNQAFIQADNIERTEPSDDPNTILGNDSTKFNVGSVQKLSVTKKALDIDNTNYKAGTIVRYAIIVTNKGFGTQFNVKLTDYIPENTEYVANSTKVNLSIIEDIDGVPPFLGGMNIGDIAPSEAKIITFDVKILDNVLVGTIISNQARIINNENIEFLSDNPDTEIENDATRFAVGKTAILSSFIKKATLVDTNSDGVANIGEEIIYEINVTNFSTEVSEPFNIVDVLPENIEYLNNFTIKERNDIDGTIHDLDQNYYIYNYDELTKKLVVKVSQLMWSSTLIISFKVKIESGEKVINQAEMTYPYPDGANYLSDDPATDTLNDATIIFIGDEKSTDLIITKEVKDLNGGVVFPKDNLEYKITIENRGNKKAENIELIDAIPSYLNFERNSEQLTDIGAHFIFEAGFGDNGRAKITNITIEAGSTFEFTFRAKIYENSVDGDIIKNISTLTENGVDKESNEVTTVVGSINGSSYIVGNLKYLTRKNEKEPLENYTIKLFRIEEGRAILENESKTNEMGNFKVINLPVGSYTLKYYNENGVLFGEEGVGFLIPEVSQNVELLFKPKGRIFNGIEGVIPNVRVYLYNNEDSKSISGSDCADKDLIELPENQQGQRVDSYGFYYFDTPKDKEIEKIGICIDGAPVYNFPSTIFTQTEREQGEEIKKDEFGFVKEGNYYLTFTKDEFKDIYHNDIILDDIKTKIKINKIVEQKEAKVGSIVTYRVTIKNESNISFENNNAVKIVDMMPKNMQYIKDSFRIYKSSNGRLSIIEGLNTPDVLNRKITFGNFDLKASEKVELSYRVVVGSNAKPGIYENIVQLVKIDEQPLSNIAKAKLKVIYDSDFDLGTIIGKVYCDDNKNGMQDLAEYGLEGVTIYSDAGFSSVTDAHGKYHFSVLKPGMHMLKLDKNTLLNGIKPLEESRIINITHGLVERVNFSVDCKDVNQAKKLKIKEKLEKRDILYEKVVSVIGSLDKEIFVNNKKISIKRFNLEKSKDFFMADEDVDLWIKENPTQMVNYYIYKYTGREFTYKIKLEENKLARFEQIRDAKHLKFKLKPGQYIAYAEIIDGKDTYTTKPIVVNVQTPPNDKGISLIKFKPIRFVFTEEATINGELITTYNGKIFKLYNSKELEKINFAFTDNKGYKANILIKDSKKIKELNSIMLTYNDNKLILGKKRGFLIRIKIDPKKSAQFDVNIEKTIEAIYSMIPKGIEKENNKNIVDIKYSNYDEMKKQVIKFYELNVESNKKSAVSLSSIAQVDIVDLTIAIPLDVENPIVLKDKKDVSIKFNKNYIIKNLRLNLLKDNISYNIFEENSVKDNVYKITPKKDSYGYLQYQIIPESYYKNLNLKYVDKIFYFSSKLDLAPIVKVKKRRKSRRKRLKKISDDSSKLKDIEKKIVKILVNGKDIKNGTNTIVLHRNYMSVELIYNDKSSLELLLNFNRDKTLLTKVLNKDILDKSKVVVKEAKVKDSSTSGLDTNGKDVVAVKDASKSKVSLTSGLDTNGKDVVVAKDVSKDKAEVIASKNKKLDSILFAKDAREVHINNFEYEDKIAKVLKVAKIKEYKNEFNGFKISLPKNGSIIKSDDLHLKGWQPKGSTVFVNDLKTVPDNIGYFNIKIPVNKDINKISVKVIDKNGNIGTISRDIKTSNSRYFVMAFAQSTIGYEKARLEDNNYVTFADENLYLHGRGVVFFKGQIKGKTLKKYLKEYFKYDKIEEVKAILHLDTGKDSDFENYVTNLINPEKFYPIYGDSSKETQEVKSKGKLYIKIDIDKSKLIVGSFNTKIHKSDLVKYDKVLSGVLIDIDKKIGSVDTKATMFYSSDELASKSLYNEFMGTGGSIYYLQSTFVEAGTERVKIIIRDRDTGIELYQKSLILNQDYSVNYATGSLILKEPLPSYVDTGFLTTGKIGDNTLMGHPVYLSVNYQSNAVVDITGNSSMGISVKETFNNKFYITGHYIRENKEFKELDNDYSVGGVGVGYDHSKDTGIFMEFAGSNNYDDISYYSENGGITFKQRRGRDGYTQYTNDPISGIAFKLKGTLALKDFSKDKILKTVRLDTVYQYMGANFHTLGNKTNPNMDIGGHKISFLARGKLSKNQDLKLSYSGLINDVYSDHGDMIDEINKHLVTLRYDHKLDEKISFGIEHQAGYISQSRGGYAFSDDQLLDRESVTNVTSFIYRHKVLDNFRFMFQQDIIEGYDKRMSDFTLGDRFQSNLTLEYDIMKKVSLIGTESVKFSGDNSTILGAKYKIDDKSSLYLNQRFIDNSGFRSSTVIGGIDEFSKDGKVYGEYQLDSGTTNEHSRALLGIGKTFKINKNFSVSGGVEHTYYKDFDNKTKNRDAISFGMNYKLKNRLTLFTKHELRYDNFDVPRLHYFALNGGQYKFSEDITFLSRINYFVTRNQDLGTNEVEMGEASFGFALRPHTFDMINILGKYSLISQMRPLSLSSDTTFRETAHLLSLTGIYEFPFKLQLSQKGIVKYSTNLESNTKQSDVITLMSLTRLSYHLFDTFDIATEYRIRSILDYDYTQGFLVEGAYKIKEYFYLGVGYNFSSFTDQIFRMNSNNEGGAFIRVMGRW